MKSNINYFCLIILVSLNLFSCETLEPIEIKFKSFVDDDEIATITTDNEDELFKAVEKLNRNGGTIYIDTPVINIKKDIEITIEGKASGGIIGIRQANGEYPRLYFDRTGKTHDLFFGGLYIDASNKFVEYLIIENSFNDGITVMGSNNIFDHVIVRYSYGSGFLVYGDFNTFNYCYSYRNCDTNSFFVTGHGFRVSGELNNVFNYCFAWDNYNSGFNYARLFNSSELSYLHSGAWNNGNVNVFTGRYDYDNGDPVDKNLWTIQDIIKSDPNFVSNYYNKKFSIENAEIGAYTANEWVTLFGPRMEGNGFTFGNVNSSQSIDVKRNSLYNVAFGHKSGGFIDDYNHKYNAYITDCVSFNNGINYKFPYYTLSRWSNNWDWGSKYPNSLNGNAKLKKPRDIESAEKIFYTTRNQIENAVYENMFPDGINFDRAISMLRE
jgi:hypothetical protein